MGRGKVSVSSTFIRWEKIWRQEGDSEGPSWVPWLGQEPSCRALSSFWASQRGYQPLWARLLLVHRHRSSSTRVHIIEPDCSLCCWPAVTQPSEGQRSTRDTKLVQSPMLSSVGIFYLILDGPFWTYILFSNILTKGWRLRKKFLQISSWSPILAIRGEARRHSSS